MHNSPADPPPVFEVFREIGILEQLSRTLLEARLPAPLIAPHFAVISHLSNGRDGAVPIDMARAFQVPKTSMTHTLKGLETHGYVELKPNPEDGRSKTVWLTEKGWGLMQSTIAQIRPDFAAVLQSYDPEKFAQLLPLLSELREIMDAARTPSG